MTSVRTITIICEFHGLVVHAHDGHTKPYKLNPISMFNIGLNQPIQTTQQFEQTITDSFGCTTIIFLLISHYSIIFA